MEMNASTYTNTDFFNNILVDKKSDFSKHGGVLTYYAPNGRQLRRAVEKAEKKSKKRGNGTIPNGFYTHTLDRI